MPDLVAGGRGALAGIMLQALDADPDTALASLLELAHTRGIEILGVVACQFTECTRGYLVLTRAVPPPKG